MKRLFRNSPHYWLWLAVAIVLAVLPHSRQTPTWIPAACVILLAWKLARIYLRPQLPADGSWLITVGCNLLALGLVLGVYLYYGSLLGRDAGVALLIILAGFKFVEARRPRDYYVLTALALFLIVTNFFFSQTIATAGYMLIVVLCLLAGLMDLNNPQRSLSPLHKLQRSGIMLAQALPLMLIVFLLFPRVPGPLWGIPEDAHAGTTGLDDFMTPGSISQLSDSNEVAFRVAFEGEAPPPARRYWRGPVLWDTDGRMWTQGQNRERGDVKAVGYEQGISYQITIEPHNRKWIFALEMPTDRPQGTSLSRDYQLLDERRIDTRRRYELTTHTSYRLSGADSVDFERALALPPNQHPQAVALARQWRADGLESREIIDQALAMFHNQTFYYTLNPPLLTGDKIDQFLFETREGFCEHYAAAFTVLMRAAGIPARVVTGYQGGTFNPVGGYYIVRQRDAHAWTEVWLNGSWQRIDPTEAVSPARIRDGLSAALPESVDEPLGVDRDSWMGRTLEVLRNNWDALNNQWNQWVLGYTQTRQRDLLNRMGIEYSNWQQLAVWLTGAIGVFLLTAGVWILHSHKHNPTDSARRLYDRFCKKLERTGVKRRSYEGPRDFAARASRRLVKQSGTIHEITDYYISIRYADRQDKNAALQYLRQLIRQFKPRTAS